jgi:hypothetical protein
MQATYRYNVIGLAALLIYLLLFLALGENNYQEIHDSLEYYVPNLRSAILCGGFWQLDPNATIESMMCGVPRHTFHNGIDFHAVIFTILEPFTAYTINFILVHVIAFIGFYLFLKDNLFPSIADWSTKYSIYTPLFAACFSVLPLYPLLGITFAGLPLLTWSFLRVLSTSKLRILDLFIVLFFAFYSSFVYVGVFAIIMTGAAVVWKTIRTKKMIFALFGWVSILAIAYAIYNYYLIYQVLFSGDFESQREYWIPQGYNWKVVVWAAYDMFFNGHYHAASFHFITLLLVAVTAFMAWKKKSLNSVPVKIVAAAVLFALFISSFYAFWQWTPIVELKEKIRFLKIFRWDRFYFFNPFVWTLIFTTAAIFMVDQIRNIRIQKITVLALFFIQLSYFVYHDPVAMQNALLYTEKWIAIDDNVKEKILGPDYLLTYKSKRGTYSGFLQEEAYSQIAQKINKPFESYRVGSIGINPALALHNGFYTVDGYMTSYPQKQKERMFEVIKNGLSEDTKEFKSFKNWGSRCYLFSDVTSCNDSLGCEMNYDYTVLKEMNCQFLISAFKIRESETVHFVEAFPSKINTQVFYLYSLI